MNCRKSRMEEAQAASSHMVTRSMSDQQCLEDRNYGKIECLLWDGFSHGQVLVPCEAQRQLVELVNKNERKNKSL